jgi:hypothetical protein
MLLLKQASPFSRSIVYHERYATQVTIYSSPERAKHFAVHITNYINRLGLIQLKKHLESLCILASRCYCLTHISNFSHFVYIFHIKESLNKRYNRFESPVSHNRNPFMWWKKKIFSVGQLHLDNIVQGYHLPSRQVRICLAVLETLSLVVVKPDGRTRQRSRISA